MRTTSLAVVFCCATIPAQTQNFAFIPDNVPTTGTINGFPFGSTGVRTQQLIPQSVLGSTPALIQDLFVAPTITSNNTGVAESEVFYGDIEIQMGLTQLTTLTNTWATNSPAPTTVYRGPLRVRFVRDQWVPLGLPAPYLWLPTGPGDNLAVDFIVWSLIDRGAVPTGYYMHVRSGGSSRAYRIAWTGSQPPTSAGVDNAGIKLGFLRNDGNFVVHGGGCAGSSTLEPWIDVAPGTWPRVGLPLDVRLRQGPPSIGAALVLGFDPTTVLGLPAPLDLGPFGAPGCFAWHDNAATGPFVATNAVGDASQIVGIPNLPGLLSLRVYSTWLCIDPLANNLGFTTSGFAMILGT